MARSQDASTAAAVTAFDASSGGAEERGSLPAECRCIYGAGRVESVQLESQ